MRNLDEAITSSELVAASAHALSQLLAHVRSGQADLLPQMVYFCVLVLGASTMPLLYHVLLSCIFMNNHTYQNVSQYTNKKKTHDIYIRLAAIVPDLRSTRDILPMAFFTSSAIALGVRFFDKNKRNQCISEFERNSPPKRLKTVETSMSLFFEFFCKHVLVFFLMFSDIV